MLCAIWYHLYILKNMKSTHGGVLLLKIVQMAPKWVSIPPLFLSNEFADIFFNFHCLLERVSLKCIKMYLIFLT